MTRLINECSKLSERDPLEPYMTPDYAALALMAIERLPTSIADPCCGTGVILDVLKTAGHIVHGSDVINPSVSRFTITRRI